MTASKYKWIPDVLSDILIQMKQAGMEISAKEVETAILLAHLELADFESSESDSHEEVYQTYDNIERNGNNVILFPSP